MFEIAWTEIFLIAVIGVIFLGPKEIPHLLYTLGRLFRRLQYVRFAMSQQFEEFMRVHDLDELRGGVNFETRLRDAVADKAGASGTVGAAGVAGVSGAAGAAGVAGAANVEDGDPALHADAARDGEGSGAAAGLATDDIFPDEAAADEDYMSIPFPAQAPDDRTD